MTRIKRAILSLTALLTFFGGFAAAEAVTGGGVASAATCSGGWVSGYYGHQAYGFCYQSTLPTNARYYIREVAYDGSVYRGYSVSPGYTAVGTYVGNKSLKSWSLIIYYV